MQKNELDQEIEEGVPGFEVDDNRCTNKESSPVSIPPSDGKQNKEMIISSAFLR